MMTFIQVKLASLVKIGLKEDDELGNNSLIENLSSGSSSEEGRNYLLNLFFSFSNTS